MIIKFFNKENYLISYMQSTKENIISIIKKLPDSATYDDVIEAIYVNQKIDKGISQIENGKTLTLEEIRKRLAPWLE